MQGVIFQITNGQQHRPALFLGFFNHFLNAGGMYSAVSNEFFQSDTCNLSSDRVKAGKCDSLGSVIDNKVNTDKGLKCADVSAFAADDPALHFIVGQRHNRNGNFACVIGCTALDSNREYVLCLVVTFFLKLALDFLELDGCIVTGLILNLLDEIALGFFNDHGRYFFKDLKLTLFDGVYFFLLFLQLL